MKKFLLILISLLLYSLQSLYSQNYTISGTVLDQDTKDLVEYAVITIPDAELWVVTDAKGFFEIKDIPSGKVTVIVSCLGYAQRNYEFNVTKDLHNIKFPISKNNLALKEVVVSAQRKADDATTSYVIERSALNHLQILDVRDITTLLPGGTTSSGNLTSSSQFALRSGSVSEMGNTRFGTAVEVDGVRLSSNSMNNSGSSSIYGTDVRNISSSNIESVEIILGVPSVEYGDLTSGVVKFKTRKGRTPLTVDFITKRDIKQYAASKGFGLGKDNGALNLSLEHTKSISNIASPYTSYTRNGISLSYSNTFNRSQKQQLALDFGITGNIGGYDSKADPDLYQDDYTKESDNVLRSNLSLKWALNKPWLNNLEWTSSVNYNVNKYEQQLMKSYSTAQASVKTLEEGYFMGELYSDNPNANVALIKPGYLNILSMDDSKQLVFASKLKATLANRFSNYINSRTMIGVDFSSSRNLGKGTSYGEMSVPSDNWRAYDYSLIPAQNVLAIYLQEQIDIPIRKTNLQLVAGLRSDMTFISGSEYGNVNSLSPRFNTKYTIPLSKAGLVRKITIRAGWGKAVKLPSMPVLYPRNTYKDISVFNTPTDVNTNVSYPAYYTVVSKLEYNPNLKWQEEYLKEFGLDFDIKGIRVSLSYFDRKSIHPYITENLYNPFSYKRTPMNVNTVDIPVENQQYSIDRSTGIVTVSDKTGALPSISLAQDIYEEFITTSHAANGSSSRRRGLEWGIDFDKIPVLRTSFSLDGKYYYYKGVNQNIVQAKGDIREGVKKGEHNYIAYYAGDNRLSNGMESRVLRTNLTIKTHIPEVRLIVSLRLEASLYNYSRSLNEYNGKPNGIVVDSRDDYFASETLTDMYGGDRFVVVYPLYYTSFHDMNTKIPFAESFLKAKESGDKELFDALAMMVKKNNHNTFFNKAKVSPYFSANLTVTKEVGEYVSLTFTANNFLNSLANVKHSQTGVESSLFNSGYISDFYYGLSLKVTI